MGLSCQSVGDPNTFIFFCFYHPEETALQQDKIEQMITVWRKL